MVNYINSLSIGGQKYDISPKSIYVDKTTSTTSGDFFPVLSPAMSAAGDTISNNICDTIKVTPSTGLLTVSSLSVTGSANLTDVKVDNISVAENLVVNGDSTLSVATIKEATISNILHVNDYIEITNNENQDRKLISLADDFDLIDFQDSNLGIKHNTANTLSIHYKAKNNMDYIYTFPNKTGTLATLDNIPVYYNHFLTLGGVSDSGGKEKMKMTMNVINRISSPATNYATLQKMISIQSNGELIARPWAGYAACWVTQNNFGTAGAVYSGYATLTLNGAIKRPVVIVTYAYSAIMPATKFVPFLPANDGDTPVGTMMFTITSVSDTSFAI